MLRPIEVSGLLEGGSESERRTRILLVDDMVSCPPLPTLGALDIERCADAIAQIGRLTLRERRILVALLRGKDNDAIVIETEMSRRTVKFHVSNVLRKLHLSQRSELIRFLF